MPIFAAALTAAGFLLPVLIPQHRQVQSSGRIVCSSGGKQIPLQGIVVNLQEYDFFDPDDFIANTSTDSSGGFYLNGSHNEAGSIDFFLAFGMMCDPHGVLAECDGHLLLAKNGSGLNLINRDENSGFCSKNCAIVAKVEIPRNYNFQEGEAYPPLFDIGNYDLAAKGKIECDESVVQSYTRKLKKMRRFSV